MRLINKELLNFDLKKIDLLECFAFLYLYLPIMIFALTWLKVIFSLIFVLCVGTSFIFIFSKRTVEPIKMTNRLWVWIIIVSICALFWGYISGIDGHFCQAWDWQKHNVILDDLITHRWPVRYNFGEESGVLCYYIGYYILPAIFGKIFGFDVATTTMLLLSVAGIVITSLLIYKNFNNKKPARLLLIFFMILTASTFFFFCKCLYNLGHANDAPNFFNLKIISKSVQIQFRCAILNIRWLCPQYIPVLIAVALIYEFRYDYSAWAFILMPLSLYNTFAFICLGGVLAMTWSIDLIQCRTKVEMIKNTFRIEFVSAIICMLLIILYIATNAIQAKPKEARMALEFINWNNHFALFVLFHASWMLWFVILGKKRVFSNNMLISAGVLLFLLPFFKMGRFNDLCTKGSAPALIIINFEICRYLIGAIRYRHWAVVRMLVILILISSLPNFHEFRKPLTKYSKNWNKRAYWFPKNREKYLVSETYLKYQYITWSPNRLADILLKKEK
ncbi:MAG: hypothetical protein IKQ61_06260 [Spirochaetales bacterium]|nr:hypothetical protein [Spirochaetales bacterium]